MGVTITSPIAGFPGTVTLSDPLSFPQIEKLETAIAESVSYQDTQEFTKYNMALLPGLLACVEAWNITPLPRPDEPVSLENFPATPRVKSFELIAWLLAEVMKLYLGTAADSSPNG